jgi:hypothetical protein
LGICFARAWFFNKRGWQISGVFKADYQPI